MLPATLEWHLAAALVALGSVFWSTSLIAVATMLLLSLGVAVLQGCQAVLAPRHEGLRSRLLIMVLCYVQPLVRSWRRYRTRLFGHCPPAQTPDTGNGHVPRMPLSGRDERAYWSEQGHERSELLGLFIAYLLEHRWGTAIDSGWSDWDIEAHAHPWTLLQIRTVQEEHGGHKVLIRVGYRLRSTPFARAAGLLGLMACGLLACFHVLSAGVAFSLLLALMLATWRRGLGLAARAIEGFEGLIRGLELVRCSPANGRLQPAGDGPSTVVRFQDDPIPPRPEVVGLAAGRFVDTSYDEIQKGVTPSGRNQSLNMVIFYRPT
jgi:hypothetical protein